MKLDDFKRGDSFALYAELEWDGEPLIIDASALRSQIRTKNNKFISELSISKDVTQGENVFVLEASDTNNWPVASLFMDIEIDDGGVITSSATIEIPVIRDVTRDD